MLVSNTSTLVLLAKVKCLEAFIEISPKIIIPKEVQQEAIFPKDSYDAHFIKQLIEERRIVVFEAEKKVIETVRRHFRLDEGEAAAYALFNKEKHKALLTDDGELIKLCKLQKIPFICAMAVIVRLYEKKKIDKEVSLKKLELLYQIGRYSEKIYEHFKKEVK